MANYGNPLAAIQQQLARAYGSATQNGQKRGQEPSGVIPIDAGNSERIEIRFWDNSQKGTGKIRVGYSKPRVALRDGQERTYRAFQLRQAMADIEGTYRLCADALARQARGEIALVDEDRQAAEQVVETLQGRFGGVAVDQANLPDLARLRHLLNGTV